MYVSVLSECIYVYHVCSVPKEAGESIKSPRTGVTIVSCMAAGN